MLAVAFIMSHENDSENSNDFWATIIGLCFGFAVAMLLFHFGILDGILNIGL